MTPYDLRKAIKNRDLLRVGEILDEFVSSSDPYWSRQEALRPLFDSITQPDADSELLRVFVEHGAKSGKVLQAALAIGDPHLVAALVEAGADIHYRAEANHDALLDAVYSRELLHDTNLLDLLNLLINYGVSVIGKSSYGESGIRVLSWIGRFDAVQLLLTAGADGSDIEFTELIEAVAFGTVADVEAVVRSGADLEEREYWNRTAWLVAVQSGDLPKAKLLRDFGARTDSLGQCGKPALHYAIENQHTPMLQWLIDIGADIEQTDKTLHTPLMVAADRDNADAVAILLKAGADVGRKSWINTTALYDAESARVAKLLLDAGADPQDLNDRARREFLGFSSEQKDEVHELAHDVIQKYRVPRFGTTNPERMNNPFWEAMLRAGVTAYHGSSLIGLGAAWGKSDYEPTWCAARFGQSMTFLPDGRIVQIAGEHEDGYDPDFYIYNDVFVHHPDGSIDIYGYPESVFPPTDSHTATLIGSSIYIVGTIGYQGTRQPGKTPVHRLDTTTFQMERLETTGENPGWIFRHWAVLSSDNEIQLSSGEMVVGDADTNNIVANNETFVLNVVSLEWRVGSPGQTI